MEDSTTFDFAEDSKAGMEFLCRLMEREVNALLLTDFAEFVANPEKDGQAVIVRNGFYARSFKTSFGMMTIRIPRDRANLYADRLPPYKHSLPGLCHDILALYRKDMTYSEIREFLMAESGCSFSETTIQKVVSSAYGEYRDFMAEELEDCPFVYLDGTWITLKRQYEGQPATVESECVLVALGITPEGRKKVLGFWVVPAEGASAWEGPLRDIQGRGCKNVRLFVTDGLNGMPEAIREVFPKARQQRCLVHVLRNIMAKARKRDRSAIAEDFKAVYDGARTREEAMGRLSGFVRKWSMTYPSLRAYLTMPNLFTYFDFPSPIRKSIYTSNAIESFNSRVKARLRKRVTMNSQENLEFCMTQVSRDYNRHSRQLRCIDGMSGEELALCGLKR